MSDSIFLQADDGSLTEVSGTPFAAEADLQELLARYVDLLPGAQINRDSPRRWLLIKREAGIPSQEGGGDWWSVDHLVVDQDAIPTFVEVKRASDTRVRREVVAQMLDYAANGSAFWSPERLRTWYEGDDPEAATERLVTWLNAGEGDPADIASSFWETVGTNLREGKIRLVFVADEIPPSLARLVEFLNEQMPRVHGDAFVHVRQLNAVVETSRPLAELRVEAGDEITDAIAHNVGRLRERIGPGRTFIGRGGRSRLGRSRPGRQCTGPCWNFARQPGEHFTGPDRTIAGRPGRDFAGPGRTPRASRFPVTFPRGR